jgi:hypothetical protein
VVTEDGRDRFRSLTPIATVRRGLRMVARSDQEDANGLDQSAAGLAESTAERQAPLQRRRLGSDDCMNRPLTVTRRVSHHRAAIGSALDRRASTQEFPTFDRL